jgi:hypothetical protein
MNPSPGQIEKWRKEFVDFGWSAYLRVKTEQATPITSADITPAMHQEWGNIFVTEDMSFASPKDGEIMAAAVNAYLGSKK